MRRCLHQNYLCTPSLFVGSTKRSMLYYNCMDDENDFRCAKHMHYSVVSWKLLQILWQLRNAYPKKSKRNPQQKGEMLQLGFLGPTIIWDMRLQEAYERYRGMHSISTDARGLQSRYIFSGCFAFPVPYPRTLPPGKLLSLKDWRSHFKVGWKFLDPLP